VQYNSNTYEHFAYRIFVLKCIHCGAEIVLNMLDNYENEFIECEACSAKCDSCDLCKSCAHNKHVITKLKHDIGKLKNRSCYKCERDGSYYCLNCDCGDKYEEEKDI